jgi:cullin 3
MTTTFWPLNHSGATCTLPLELQQAAKVFERFYLSRHSGRKLTWQPALGNVDVRVHFKNKTHDLNMPTFSMVILSLFENMEEDEQLSYEVWS